MIRKIVKIAAVLLVIGLVVPEAVQAASAAFSSNTTTPAVKGTNTAAANGAKGVEGYASGASGTTYGVMGTAKSASGIGVFGQNQSGSGKAVGLYGKSISSTGHAIEGYASSGAGSGCTTAAACQHFGVAGYAQGGSDSAQPLISGVFGSALAGSGWTNGVTGYINNANTTSVGVRGYSASGYGMIGEGGGAGIIGFGDDVGPAINGLAFGSGPGVEGDSFGSNRYGVVSGNDLGVADHLVGTADVAGTCTINANTNTSGANCTSVFPVPFPAANGSPILVLTPLADPGGYWWVSGFSTNVSGDYTGFTIMRSASPANANVFNYVVVGTDSSLAAAPARAAAKRRASFAHRYQ